MIKRLYLVLILITIVSGSWAQNLRFRNNGEFKIVQFTDIHYNGSNASEAALGCIDSVLIMERPDLIVLTGDIIWGRPAKKNLLRVLEYISRYDIPFAYEFGNHDYEQGLTNRELYEIARGVKNNVLPPIAPDHELDYELQVLSHDGKKVSSVLYCLDTHSYPKDKSLGTYAWLNNNQIQWYRTCSAVNTQDNNGVPLPSLAFFHIALPEYHDAVRDENATLIGNRREEACSPIINTGMFASMLECGDVMGMFVGHDHDNDYSVLWHNILLAYGRYSGGNTVYNHLPCGARVIVLKENQRRFETYIRECSGKIAFPSIYPDSYVFDDWEKRPVEKW